MPLPKNRPPFVSRADWNVVSSPRMGSPRSGATAKHQAIHKALEFMERKGAAAFPKFTRAGVAEGLYDRVNDPSLIDQSSAQLCGPAVLLHNRARQKPGEYVDFVTELYETGASSFGNLKVRAGSDLRGHDPSKSGSLIHPADWIPLASIRDSQNKVWDFDAVDDTILKAGTTAGELKSWLTKVGYNQVSSSTDYFNARDFEHLLKTNQLYKSGHKIFLMIDGRLLTGQKTATKRGNHWVMLRSPIKFQRIFDRRGQVKRSSISFKVFSWGKIYSVPASGTMPIGYLLLHYFGYVAAKYVKKAA